jgi:ADP-ribosylglycohydrolase
MNVNEHMEVLMNIYNALSNRVWNILLSAGLFIASNQILPVQSTSIDYTSAFAGSMLAGGIGDALGRVTEFIKSTDSIFEQYPRGVRTYDDFLLRDWSNVPAELKNNNIAPYTDDTAMAKLVLTKLIYAKKYNWDLHITMCHIAASFVKDAHDTSLGWVAPFRAPGNACIAGVKQLGINWYENQSWNDWDVLAHTAGGCGSVMRAHPFGLVFADDPEKAALWAAEHSRLTHGNPMALAACAAMATGVAYAVQGKTPEFIVEKMIAAARQYDEVTATKIESAYISGHQAGRSRSRFDNIFQAYDNAEFRRCNDHVFSTFLGWAAHDAIAATVYAFTLSPNNVMEAIYLGVHTPGDSDSIASMAGALVGARVGAGQLPKELVEQLEGSAELASDAAKAANLFKAD